MQTSLYIARLPVDFSDEELRRLVQPYGTVLVAMMTVSSKEPGHGRGYIQMLTGREAVAVKVHLHRTSVRGNEILVFFDE